MQKAHYSGGVKTLPASTHFVGLFAGAKCLGLYIADDSDVTTNLGHAALFTTKSSAEQTVDHAQRTWLLNHGEQFKALSIVQARHELKLIRAK